LAFTAIQGERKQQEQPAPDTSLIKDHEIVQDVGLCTGNAKDGLMQSVLQALQ
jgi:hypothetical protein